MLLIAWRENVNKFCFSICFDHINNILWECTGTFLERPCSRIRPRSWKTTSFYQTSYERLLLKCYLSAEHISFKSCFTDIVQSWSSVKNHTEMYNCHLYIKGSSKLSGGMLPYLGYCRSFKKLSLNPIFFSCGYKMAGVYINVYPDDTWVTGKSLLYYNVWVIIVYYIDACEILIFPSPASETKADISSNICFTAWHHSTIVNFWASDWRTSSF